MECNKDAALRAKEIAEKKILEKKFVAASKLAEKAQTLYPNIDGLPQLIATIKVYVASLTTVGEELDWYAILGAQRVDDDEKIRKCYKNMALTLHPDKNKSVGAEGAFNLVSQAWTILSDKAKRATFDKKYRLWDLFNDIPGGVPPILASRYGLSNAANPARRPPVPASQNGFSNNANPAGIPPIPANQNGLSNAANPAGRPPVPANQNGLSNTTNPAGRPPVPASQNGFFNAANQKDRDHMSAAHANPTSRPPLKTPTFWTLCSLCRTHYEYPAVYKDCNLSCTTCKKPFLASEVPPPSVYTNASSASRPSQMMQHNFNSTGVDRNCHVSSMTQMSAVNSLVGSMPGGISGGALGSFTRPSVNLKRKYEDSAPVMREEVHFGKTHAVERTAAGSDFQSCQKKRCTGEHKVDSDRRDMETEMTSKKGINSTNGFGSLKNSFDAGKVSAAGNFRRNGIRDISQQQMKNILAGKARNVILKKLDELKESRRKLDEWKAIRKKVDERHPSSILKNTDSEVRVKDTVKAINGVKPGPKAIVDSETNNNSISADSEVLGVSMDVPDPDFHDFDGDRVEDTFGENQVWAAYDDEDGMPRYYAFIHSVVSKKPFQMKISWLSSKTNDELAPIRWIAAGFPKTTGDLRLGKRAISSTLNSFSHKVEWTKGSRGLIHIYPKKGEVWALYRNWSLDWDELTKDQIIHQYDMVEVLGDYNEEHGVNVAPLFKVAGFRTVFRKNADPRKIRNIPRAEMFRFSHQVPSYLLTGQEGDNVPKGCLELDPASTPMELLQLITDDAPKQEDSAEDVPRQEVAEAQEGKVWPENLHVYKRMRFGGKSK
ncbi:curved DNA-binding protein [Trifolium pratense]|uniref:Curved DNA-binding protein n=1 Tax=Trifolium pratense TaxID=57577 RepID=A0A2K3MSU6_TRIPR|nr:curved DNA-binding protein [Trifolium pratense]PNX93826.1 curved DNA-binding protein [Trifolium pratense]